LIGGEVSLVDAHVHIGSSEKLSRCWSLAGYSVIMDYLHIDYAVVMPNIANRASFRELNEEFMSSVLEVDNPKLLPFLLLDPDGQTTEQIWNNKDKIKGIKYHPSCSRKTIDEIDLDVPDFLPILVHCGRDPLSSIDYLIKVATKYPSKIFIAAHMAGMTPDVVEPSILKVKYSKVSNIWMDTSSVNLPWMIDFYCNVLGDTKLLFASDEPFQDIRVNISCLNYSNISSKSKERIFHGNAESLFYLY
jgi:hypothetical protein